MEEKPREIQSGRILHKALGFAIIFMAISGLLLYIPNLRGITADYRWLLSQGHEIVGLTVPLLLILNIPFFLHPSVFDKMVSLQGNAVLLLGAVIVQLSTGLTLYLFKTGVVQTPVIAMKLHIITAVFFLPVLILHIYWTRTAKLTKDLAPVAPDAATVSRRRLITGLGTLLALVGSISGVEWLKDYLATSLKSETLSNFEDCNRMIPQPTPSPATGSMPGYTGQFRVYTVTDIPCADSGTWSFSVEGLVRRPAQFRWSDFIALPRVVQLSDFHCVEGWSVKQVTYEGIPLSLLLGNAGLMPEARFVKFISGDGVYSDALSLEQAMMSDVMVAILIDGQPIPSSLGGPARLVIPQMFGYKAVKWLTKIELIDQPYLGYWEQRGYPVDGWTEHHKG